ncbi:MAG: hypothetical protein KY451_06630 [Actinobacteria bacterium]|nr:hypothetical protein [Actinomycetota bacterium]
MPVVAVFALGVNVVADVTPTAGTGSLDFLTTEDLRPEPGEQRAYLLLLLAPLALAAAVLTGIRWGDDQRGGRFSGILLAVGLAGQGLLLSLIVVSVIRQGEIYSYFASWQWGLSVGIGLVALVIVLVAPRIAVGQWTTSPLRTGLESGYGRAVSAIVVVAFTAAYVSTTVYRDANIASALSTTSYHLVFTLDEFAAVLGGRTPLVDVVPQYASLLPYLAWPFLMVAGLSVTTMTLFFAALSGVALLSVFVAFWKVTGSAALAAILYLPFLSITFYPALRDGAETASVATYYAAMPLRYFFPLLLTALVAFLAPRAKEWRAAVLLGGTAGAGLVNNIEFGIAALGAVVVAVFVGALSTGPTTRRWQAAFVAELRLLVGVLLAVLLFVLGTLVRSGSLPDFSQSLYFSRQFAASGFYMLPLPGPLGLHLVMYLTGALALVMALVCAVRGSVRPGGTGPAGLALLGYTSVFGLGAGSYYVGRSHPYVLIAVFCAWALCSATLTVEVVGRLSRADLRLPARLLQAMPVAAVAALCALIASTLSGADVLAGQTGRLRAADGPTTLAALEMRAFVRDCAAPGESVMLLYPLGHWIAADAGVENFFPYNLADSIITEQQVAEFVASLREHKVTSVFVGSLASTNTTLAITSALIADGYEVVLERPAAAPVAELLAGGELELWRRPSAQGPCS